MSNYLAYGEVAEGSGWANNQDLEFLKNQWCFAMRIFEVPENFNMDEFNKLEKPRYPKIKDLYPLVHKDNSLIHESE